MMGLKPYGTSLLQSYFCLLSYGHLGELLIVQIQAQPILQLMNALILYSLLI